MRQTFTETTKKQLIKKFHTLLAKAGIDENGKIGLLWSYGVSSSTELDIADLVDICERVEAMTSKDNADIWRKRLIASIDGYLKITNQERNIDIIKAIAVRASGFESFNKIPVSRLRNLYYAFNDKQKDMKTVNNLYYQKTNTLKN